MPDGAEDVLDRHERQRWTAFARPADARRFLLGALVVREVAAAWLGVPPAQVAVDRTCTTCARHHGRPRVAGLDTFSVSHAGDLVVVALGPGRVGVDVERVGRGPVDVLASEVLHPTAVAEVLADEDPPRAFVARWTEIEAALKATGDGLRTDPRSVAVTTSYDVRTAAAPGHPPLRLRPLEAPAADHLAALATDP